MKYVYILCLFSLCLAGVMGMAYARAIVGGNGTPLKAAFAPLQALESASRVKRQAVHIGYGYQNTSDSYSDMDDKDGQDLDNENNQQFPFSEKK